MAWLAVPPCGSTTKEIHKECENVVSRMAETGSA
jgi:hypothetical protein